jgi:putative ABC transport system ATP-binding protein
VKKIMQRLSIEDIASKFPMQVSGGQKQRCACARAFIGSPNLILADEPTGALDSVSAKQLLELLNELNIEEHTTILMVTHDPVSASYGNRVLFLKDGYLRKELCKDNMNRKSFYHAILAEISLGEGEQLC